MFFVLEYTPVCLTNMVRPFFISLMVSKAVIFHFLVTHNYFIVIKHMLIVFAFGAISRAYSLGLAKQLLMSSVVICAPTNVSVSILFGRQELYYSHFSCSCSSSADLYDIRRSYVLYTHKPCLTFMIPIPVIVLFCWWLSQQLSGSIEALQHFTLCLVIPIFNDSYFVGIDVVFPHSGS